MYKKIASSFLLASLPIISLADQYVGSIVVDIQKKQQVFTVTDVNLFLQNGFTKPIFNSELPLLMVCYNSPRVGYQYSNTSKACTIGIGTDGFILPNIPNNDTGGFWSAVKLLSGELIYINPDWWQSHNTWHKVTDPKDVDFGNIRYGDYHPSTMFYDILTDNAAVGDLIIYWGNNFITNIVDDGDIVYQFDAQSIQEVCWHSWIPAVPEIPEMFVTCGYLQVTEEGNYYVKLSNIPRDHLGNPALHVKSEDTLDTWVNISNFDYLNGIFDNGGMLDFSGTFVPEPPKPPFVSPYDIDGDSKVEALTDMILLIRYLFGFAGDSLVKGALGKNATRTTSDAIIAYLDDQISSVEAIYDIDGNGSVDSLTDGLLLLRYTFGFRGDSLISQVIAVGSQRTTAQAIEGFILLNLTGKTE